MLPASASLQPLLDATAGVTHLLPLVVRGAQEAKASNATFGVPADGKARLTVDLLLTSARALAARPAEEKQALYQQLVADAEAAERAAIAKAAQDALRRAEVAAKEAREKEATEREAELARQEWDMVFQRALAAEAREDARWFRKKDYGEALGLFELLVERGHPEAAEALARVRRKAEGKGG